MNNGVKIERVYSLIMEKFVKKYRKLSLYDVDEEQQMFLFGLTVLKSNKILNLRATSYRKQNIHNLFFVNMVALLLMAVDQFQQLLFVPSCLLSSNATYKFLLNKDKKTSAP